MSFGGFDRNRQVTSTLSEINMVPLIDVMLVLLVIFIITAPLLSHSISINLPQASSEPVEQEPAIIDVAIDAQGRMYWNEEPIQVERLTERFRQEAGQDPQPDLRLRADLDTRYEVVAKIMSQAKQAGLKRIGFVTRPAPDSQ